MFINGDISPLRTEVTKLDQIKRKYLRRETFPTEELEGECASVDDDLEFEDPHQNERYRRMEEFRRRMMIESMRRRCISLPKHWEGTECFDMDSFLLYTLVNCYSVV